MSLSQTDHSCWEANSPHAEKVLWGRQFYSLFHASGSGSRPQEGGRIRGSQIEGAGAGQRGLRDRMKSAAGRLTCSGVGG